MAKLELSLTKEQYSALADSIKEFYVEAQDGSYELDGVGSIKRALDAEKKSKADAVKAAAEKAAADAKAEALKPYEGLDLEAAKEALAKAAKAEEDKLKGAGDFDSLKKQLEERFAKDLEAKDKELVAIMAKEQGILAKLKRYMLGNLLTEKGVLPQRVKFLVNELDRQIEIEASEDDFKLKKIGGIGDAPELEAMIDGLKAAPETEFFFAADNASGSGASGSGNGHAGKKVLTRSALSELSPADQMAFAKEVNLGKAVLQE